MTKRKGQEVAEMYEYDGNLESYLDRIGTNKPLSIDEERKLATQLKKGDLDARDRLVEANLRFVVSVAMKYRGKGLSISDLISVGNLGLIKATEHFDESLGYKFISYGVWWIRQAIQQALYDQTRIIHQPWNRIGKMIKFSKFADEFRAKHERNPSAQELADEFDMTEQAVLQHQGSNNRVASLDRPMLEDGDPLLDITPDETQVSPDEEVTQKILGEKMREIVDNLGVREADIIRQYYGIDCEAKTLEEIGETYSLTRERVRQIKQKALKQLRYRCKEAKVSSLDLFDL